MKNFYVYYSYEEWGRGYIGKRECYCLPEEDVKYFGSFKDKTFKPTQKIILATFATKQEAVEAEIVLHDFFSVDKNPNFANKAKQRATGFSYDRTGHKNSEYWRQRVTGDNHPSKRPEVQEKIRQYQLGLGEKHNSKRPEHREKVRQRMTGDNNPNSSPEGRERCRQRMQQPERRELARKTAAEVLRKRIEKNPNCQSEAARLSHALKDEQGRSILALNSYYKGLGARDENGNLLYPRPPLNDMLYCDPDHPELGQRSPGTLVRMQKSRGYPHGPANRVKVGMRSDSQQK